MKLNFLEEWVSEQEQKARVAIAEEERKSEEWLSHFRATDALYLCMTELLKDPLFSPDPYDGVGTTHDQWCPDFKGAERRMCRRIMAKGAIIFELEWGVDRAPIKLIVYKDGKHIEDQWFEHSIRGRNQAFQFARNLLTRPNT